MWPTTPPRAPGWGDARADALIRARPPPFVQPDPESQRSKVLRHYEHRRTRRYRDPHNLGVSVMSLGVIQRDAKLGVGKHNRIEAHHVGFSSANDAPRASGRDRRAAPTCELVGYSSACSVCPMIRFAYQLPMALRASCRHEALEAPRHVRSVWQFGASERKPCAVISAVQGQANVQFLLPSVRSIRRLLRDAKGRKSVRASSRRNAQASSPARSMDRSRLLRAASVK